MKKQAYVTPLVEVEIMETESIMDLVQASGPVVYSSQEDDGVSDENEILSRESLNVWDDEY